ncbi:MAG: YkvA family protein [Woeseiaceae bacterium]
MQFDQIRELIEEGKTTERQTGILRQAVINLANANGRRVTELKVQRVISFVTEYIEHAPALMRQIEEAAAKSGAQHHVQPVLDATEDYFLAPDDVIPDHLGLVGLLDDAYLTRSLMLAISERYMSQSGESLLPIEAREDNAFIRRLIGEPFASILDDHVSATLGSTSVQQNIDQILITLSQMNLTSGPDPIWGNVHASDTADARLGSMGVF